MQRHNAFHDDVDRPKNIDHSKWPNTRDVLSKKFGSIMASLFGKGKSRVGYCYKVRRDDGNGWSHRNFPSKSSKMRSFSSLFQSRARTSFTGGKTSETTTNVVEICDGISNLRLPSTENDGGNNGEDVEDLGLGRQGSKRNLPRVPSRIMTTRHRLKMSSSLRKLSSRRIEMKVKEDGEDERKCCGEEELCKKRILLGEKCRPLNHSGTLRYDKDGILLPELIF